MVKPKTENTQTEQLSLKSQQNWISAIEADQLKIKYEHEQKLQ